MEWLQLVLEIIKQEYILIFIFFSIAILYSMIGFGGGSSYSAMLSLTEIPFVEVRVISLLCNIVVVTNNTLQFINKKLLNWKKVLPLVMFSVPFAFFGGYLKINQKFFYITLGVSLVLSAVLILANEYLKTRAVISFKRDYSVFKNALIGSVVGFISGMVGIGGGVFLAPFLHITKWDSPKKIVATSSFFILVNSISGLLGQVFNPFFKIHIFLTVILILSVLVGGIIGVNLSLKQMKANHIKRITAFLIAVVGIKIIYSSI